VNSLHACALAQPSRATGLGQLPGRAGWVQPSPKKTKKNRKCRNKNFACLRKNIFLSIYSLKSGSGNKKEKIKKKIYEFFSNYEFLPTPELELFVVEFLPTPELELFGIEYSLAPESGIL